MVCVGDFDRSPQDREILRPQDVRFPCDQKVAGKLRFCLRFKRSKLIPIVEIPCDTQVFGDKSLANGNARVCTQVSSDDAH